MKMSTPSRFKVSPTERKKGLSFLVLWLLIKRKKNARQISCVHGKEQFSLKVNHIWPNT
jgi:hypothetical protein